MMSRIFQRVGVIVGSLVLGFAAAWADDTIVPATDRVSDLDARLAYARILAYRPETLANAIAEYERVLRENPVQPDALASLAELRVRQGDFAAAERQLHAVLQLKPADPAAVAPLAKLYLWTNRAPDAQALLDATAAVRPLTDDEAILAAQTLSRLGRSAEAQRRFEALLAATPLPSAELISAAADASLAAGRLAQARDLYQRALTVNPSLAGALRGYALTLAWTGDDTAARPRLEAVQRADPTDGDVIHAYLGTLVHQDGVAAAASRAREGAEAAPKVAAWRVEWAELETRQGHAVKARQLFAEALALSDTPEMRLRTGKAAITWGDFNRAEVALREALQGQPADESLQDELGRLLVSADRFEEADQLYERWLLRAPSSQPALLGLTRLRLKEKDFARALTQVDAMLVLWPDDPDATRLRAQTLFALRRWSEAAADYRRLGARQEHRVEAEVALGRVARAEGQAAESAAHFATALELAPENLAARFYAADASPAQRADLLKTILGRPEEVTSTQPDRGAALFNSASQLTEWSGLFAQDGDFDAAVKCLEAARAADPDYYPAWAQMAEFLAIDAQFDAALREFGELKKTMPATRQVLLGEARAFAWARQYRAALDAYARLAELNPADPVPRREAARTAGWGKMRDRAAALYATAWAEQPVDRALADELRRALDGAPSTPLATRWLEWARTPTAEAEPFAATARFAADRFALRDELPESRRAALETAYLNVLPALRLQRAWWLENSAKQFAWDRRYTSAESADQRLLAVEPGNEEALFDLSQVQAAQGLGQREHATLTRLLALDSNHSLALHAAARRTIRSRPLADLEGRFWHERGRGDLSSLARTTLVGEVQDTFFDQMSVRASGLIGREAPLARAGRYAFRGNGLDVDGVLPSGLSGSAGFLHREFYNAQIGHVDSGQAQLWLKRDSFGVGVGYERREEITNPFALFAGTRSDNVWLAETATLTRRFDLDGRVTATSYSDANHGVDVLFQPAYAWTDHPDIFKTILTLEYRDTNQPTLEFRNPAGTLLALTHPYWTPRNYAHGALTLEWYQDRAKEFFVGSSANFYDLKVTFGYDSESNPSATFEGDWNNEWYNQWVAHASAYVNVSREWNAIGLRLRLARRF